MVSRIRLFHEDERGEMQEQQATIVALGILFCSVMLFGGQISAGIAWLNANGAVIFHVVVSLVILFGGSYFAGKTSRSFDQAWSLSNVFLVLALMYLAATVGLPMLRDAIQSETDKFFNQFGRH